MSDPDASFTYPQKSLLIRVSSGPLFPMHTLRPMLRLFTFLSLAALPLPAAEPAPAEQPALTAPTPYAWKNVAITGGGFVTGIIPHPAKAGLMYARTDVGGAYRWDSATNRWHPITDWIDSEDWSLAGIESLAIDPTDANRVYLAAGSYTNNWSGNGAILRSTDRGATWQRTNVPFKFGGNELGRSNGERLMVDPSAPVILFLGTRHDGLWRSADHGETWTRVDSFTVPDDTKGIGINGVVFPPAANTSPTPTPVPTAVLYVTVSSPTAALWRSPDAGKTWSVVPGQPKGQRPYRAKFGTDGALYITYSNECGPNGITNGAVWKYLPASSTWTNITPLAPGDGDRFGYAGLALDARHPGTLLVATICRWGKHDNFFRSTDAGATWKPLSPQATFDDAGVAFLRWGKPYVDLGHWVGTLEIDPFDSDHALYGTGMTMFATHNLTAIDADQPTAWKVCAQGVEETVLNEVVSPAAGAPLLSVMWDIDGFRHESLDESPAAGFFTPSHGKDTGIDVAELQPDIAARVFYKGGAWSDDNGRTWTPFATVPDKTKGDGRIAVSAGGDTLVWTPDHAGTSYSFDKGETWKPSTGLPENLRPVADRAANARFYAFDPRKSQVYVSTDHGVSYKAAAKLDTRGGLLKSAPDHPGHVWVISAQGLFRSTDAGATFTRVSSEATGDQLGFGRAAAGSAYPTLFISGSVAGEKGIFRSTDSGITWTRISPIGLGFHSISTLAGDPRVFGRVYIGTRGRGIFYGEPAPTFSAP